MKTNTTQRLLGASIASLLATTALSAQCETGKLIDTSGLAYDSFGLDLELENGLAIVGAHGDDLMGSKAGAAHIFRQNGTQWVHETELTAFDGTASDWFGSHVSTDGTTVVVSAWGDDDKGSTSGSVYVFEQVMGVWTMMTKLTASDGAASGYFGHAVSVDGDVIAVGAYGDAALGSLAGAVYVYTKTYGVWSETAKLTASDGATRDYFGWDVALDAGNLIVGAYGDDDNGSASGSAYLFELQGSTWVERHKWIASDGSSLDYFGYAVDIEDGVAAVGAHLKDGAGTDSGAAYVWRNDPLQGWQFVNKLLASDEDATDNFGGRVATDGVRVIVGAPGSDDIGTDSGASYVFEDQGAGFVEIARLTSLETGSGDLFGSGVAIEGDVAMTGSEGQSSFFTSAGAAFVHGLGASGCPPLMADFGTISVSAGGTQTMTLNAGAAFGNGFYFLLGSLTGSTPGLAYGGLPVPLNLDNYFMMTLTNPNTGPFTNNLGFLDAGGSQLVQFTLGAGSDPSLAGLNLTHCFLVLDSQTVQPLLVSNTSTLSLVP
jgi:hypothetical protein